MLLNLNYIQFLDKNKVALQGLYIMVFFLAKCIPRCDIYRQIFSSTEFVTASLFNNASDVEWHA